MPRKATADCSAHRTGRGHKTHLEQLYLHEGSSTEALGIVRALLQSERSPAGGATLKGDSLWLQLCFVPNSPSITSSCSQSAVSQ